MGAARHAFDMEQAAAAARDLAIISLRYYRALIEEGADPMVALRLTGEMTRGLIQPRKDPE